MKILINALSGIGDALMFTPSLKLLKKAYPDSEIHALIMIKPVNEFYQRNSAIDKIIYFDFISEGFLNSLKFVLSLRKKYDVSINVYPSNRKEYNIINFLLGAPRKAAVKYLRKDFQNFGFLNNVRIIENDDSHNVQTNLNLCKMLTKTDFKDEAPLEFPLLEKDITFAASLINNLNMIEGDLVIGFHPGSAVLKNQAKRRWEPEKFAQLGKELIENKHAKILVFGGPDEDDLKEKIVDQINSPAAFNIKTNKLAETAAVIKRCNLFVTNDSSLMHVASALQLKVAAILGPTNQNYIHPWKTEHKIIRLDLDCSPCFIYSPRPLKCFRTDVKFKCIKELEVEMVYEAVEELLENK